MSDNKPEENTEEDKMQVRIFKLKSGEEIVSAVEGVMKEPGEEGRILAYKILDPAFAVSDPNNPNSMAFVPWIMFSEDREFEIDAGDLLFKPKKCEASIVMQYKEHFARTMELKAKKEDSEEGVILTPESNIVTLK